jgi:hypothetical protein
MLQKRSADAAIQLPKSGVLIIGGQDGSTALASTEIWDADTGKFTASGSMSTAREDFTATDLGDGRILVTGGLGVNTNTLASAEIYDPQTGHFTATGSMAAPRADHTATLLQNNRVLITGGFGAVGKAVASAELYDPATGKFTPTGPMTNARDSETATLLLNGKVLLAGGYDAAGNALASADLYDPATGLFTATGSMTHNHYSHTATYLKDGRVLIAGGHLNGCGSGALCDTGLTATAELYDPSTGKFTAAGSMAHARAEHAAVQLQDGGVLVVGGSADSFPHPLASAEIGQV